MQVLQDELQCYTLQEILWRLQMWLNPEPWTMKNLDVVLKYLKRNKSRDPLGYANELFRPETAGEDLILAIFL